MSALPRPDWPATLKPVSTGNPGAAILGADFDADNREDGFLADALAEAILDAPVCTGLSLRLDDMD